MPTTMTSTPKSPDLIAALTGIVGTAQVLTDPADIAPFVTDWRGRYRGAARCVVRPGNAEEVAAVVKAFDLLDAVDVRTAMPGARCHDELLVSRGGEEIGGVMRRAKIGNQRLLIKEELESSQIIVIMVLAVVAASDREGDEPLLGLLLKDRHLLIG